MMLEGMKILSFVHGLYGGSASQILADLGAEVVRVEWDMTGRIRPGSVLDGENGLFFQMTGRNQKSISFNPQSPEGIDILHRLLQDYDIVLDNSPPGLLEGWGIQYDELLRSHKQLIWCICTADGSGCCQNPDDELLMEAKSGLASLNGPGSKPPVPAGAALIEQHAAVLIALGIIAAARHRNITGQGHKVETNLLSASLDLQIETIGYYLNGGRFIDRADTGLSTRIHQSPYGVYPTADGCITVSLTHHDRLCSLFTPGVIENFTEQDAMERRVEFDQMINQEMQKKTTAQWVEIFECMEDMWFAPVNEYEQVMKDDQVLYNRPFIELGESEGRILRGLGHANYYDGVRPAVRNLPPAFGQHTDEILEKAGYTQRELNQLERKGLIVRNHERKN